MPFAPMPISPSSSLSTPWPYTTEQTPMLRPDERALVTRWSRSLEIPTRQSLRARIVVLCDAGMSQRQVALVLEVSRHTVDLWVRRYKEGGADSLVHDRPGRGRKRSTPRRR